MSSVRTIAGGFIAMALVASSVGEAVELKLEADQIHWIANEDGDSRVLLRFPGIREVEEQWVSTASLTFRLPGVASDSRFAVEADLLATAWDRGATWTTPWSVPGGDREGNTDGASVVHAGRSVNHLSLDVTSQIRLIAEGEAANHGFVLVPAHSRHEAFAEDELEVLGSLETATLVIQYRKLTALGVRGGARTLLERKRAVHDEGHQSEAPTQRTRDAAVDGEG